MLISGASLAQKVDLDKHRMELQVTQYPEVKLSDKYQNFGATVSLQGATGNYLDKGNLENQIRLSGFQRKSDSPDIHISYTVQSMEIVESNVTESKEERKDKAGNITILYSYSGRVTARFKAFTVIKDNLADTIILKETPREMTESPYLSKVFATRSEAEGHLRNNMDNIKTELLKRLVDRKISSINSYLDQKYGYPLVSKAVYIQHLDSKKHPEYEKALENFKIIKENLSMIKGNEPIPDQVKNNLLSTLDYYSQLTSKYNPTEKHEGRLVFMGYYNTASIYFILEDFDNMNKAIVEIAKDPKLKKEVKYFEEESQKILKVFEREHTNSLHYINPREVKGQ
ncbi:hypothetical protein M472_16815 [Sphingobacterium paucimobilis HER1398]|uniref:Uncharacterized protein n=2 Tax=Sphingobacterium TaxID=28453 RepID=U2HF64_9SPHI|nr:hypothetical protein M472_16815 [Sphingobacterium paucimobilis HER1398]